MDKENRKERTAVRRDRMNRTLDEMKRYPLIVRWTLGVPLSWIIQYRLWKQDKANGSPY